MDPTIHRAYDSLYIHRVYCAAWYAQRASPMRAMSGLLRSFLLAGYLRLEVPVKFWFDCAHCGESWECCGICHRGALVESTLWGEPDAKRIECKGGCGWGVAWRPR